MNYITPKQAARMIGLPEDSPLMQCITWAAFEYAYQRGHYTWRNDPEIPRIREIFTKAVNADSIYSAFEIIRGTLKENPGFMSNHEVINEEYFKWAIQDARNSSWCVMSPGAMSSIYDLKAFLDERGESSWSWEIPAGTDNVGVRPPMIKFHNLT